MADKDKNKKSNGASNSEVSNSISELNSDIDDSENKDDNDYKNPTNSNKISIHSHTSLSIEKRKLIMNSGDISNYDESEEVDSETTNRSIEQRNNHQLPSVYKKRLPSRYAEPRPKACKQTFLRIFLCLFFLLVGALGAYFLIDYLLNKKNGTTSGNKTLIPGTENYYVSTPKLPIKTDIDDERTFEKYIQTKKSILVWDATSKKTIKDMSSIEVLYYNFNESGDYLIGFLKKHSFSEVMFYIGCGEWDSASWETGWIPSGDGIASLIQNINSQLPEIKIGLISYFNDDKNSLGIADVRKVSSLVYAVKETLTKSKAYIDSIFLDIQPNTVEPLPMALEAYATLYSELEKQIPTTTNNGKKISVIGEITQFEYGSGWFFSLNISNEIMVFDNLYEQYINKYLAGNIIPSEQNTDIQFARALFILLDEVIVISNSDTTNVSKNIEYIQPGIKYDINQQPKKEVKHHKNAISNSEFLTNNMSQYLTFFDTVYTYYKAYNFQNKYIRASIDTLQLGKAINSKKSEALFAIAELQGKYSSFSQLGPITISSYKNYNISLYHVEPVYGKQEYLVNLYYYEG